MAGTTKKATGATGAARRRRSVLRLPAILGIAQVAELRQRFDKALNAGRPLALDGCAVEQVDGAGLQLLLAFHRSAQCRGLMPVWQKPSSSLNEAAALLGLDSALGLAPAVPDMQSQRGS